jgi:hypothetical protein
MPTRTRLILLAVAAVAFAVAVPWLKRQVDIDRCLDAGGCWDASKEACEREVQANCQPGGSKAR